MALIASTTFEGETIGAAVTAAMCGVDSMLGTEPMTVITPGLDSSTRAAEVVITTGQRSAYKAVSTNYVTLKLRFKSSTVPSGVAGIIKCSTGGASTGNTQQALAYFTTGGVIKLRSSGSTLVADNTDVYTDGVEYDVHYELDRVGLLQTMWITSDAGYYKQLGPAAVAATPTGIEWGICNSINTWTSLIIDSFELYDTQETPPSPPAAPDALISVISGHPTEFGFTVQMETEGVDDVRLMIDPDGAATTTDPVSVVDYTGYGSTPVTWNGADAQTTYEYQCQGRIGAGPWTDIGDRGFATSLPTPGAPAAEVRMALTVCEFPTYSTRAAWDVILASDAAYWFQLGDWVYADDLTENMELRRRYLLDILQDKPGMADVCRERTLLGYTASDHDRTNQTVTSDPSIGACIAAQKQVIPNPTIVTFPTEETTCSSFLIGRDLYILCDPRTEDREEGTSRGGPNDAQLWGPEQKAWIFEQIRRTDCDFRFLVHEMPMVGDAGDVVPKDDHGANYPVDIDDLGDVMREMDELLGRPAGFVIGGDYHCLGLWHPGDHVNIPWGGIVGGGTANDTGNGRDPQNYFDTFGFNDDTPSGTAISVYWKLTTTDDGTNRTLTIKGWDSFTDDLASPGLEYITEWSSDYVPIQPQGEISAAVRAGWVTNLIGGGMFNTIYRRSDSEEQVLVSVYLPPGNTWGDPTVTIDLIPRAGGATETLEGTVVGSTSGPYVIVRGSAVVLAAGTWDVVVGLDRPTAFPRLNAGQIISKD